MLAATSDSATVAMPTPTIKIDNASDPFATIVKVDFGDRLGELLDTVCAVGLLFSDTLRPEPRDCLHMIASKLIA